MVNSSRGSVPLSVTGHAAFAVLNRSNDEGGMGWRHYSFGGRIRVREVDYVWRKLTPNQGCNRAENRCEEHRAAGAVAQARLLRR
jgi:hypothetical protein